MKQLYGYFLYTNVNYTALTIKGFNSMHCWSSTSIQLQKSWSQSRNIPYFSPIITWKHIFVFLNRFVLVLNVFWKWDAVVSVLSILNWDILKPARFQIKVVLLFCYFHLYIIKYWFKLSTIFQDNCMLISFGAFLKWYYAHTFIIKFSWNDYIFHKIHC
jgi:hypothetical protein